MYIFVWFTFTILALRSALCIHVCCRCDIIDIVLEMHRILRPNGAVIIRDKGDVILKVKEISDRIRWKGTLVAGEQDGHSNPEMIMVINHSE